MTDLLAAAERILDGTDRIDDHHPLRLSGASTLQEVAPRVAFVGASGPPR